MFRVERASDINAGRYPLRWQPPTLTNPTTLTVTTGGTQTLTAGQDYIVNINVNALSGVALVGGRNVKVIGGYIRIPTGGGTVAERRAMLIKDATGTVHIEGMLLTNDSGGDMTEGIQIDAPNAIVQIQNTRIDAIHATDESGFTDNHPDLIQPYGGVRELRIDRFTGVTDCQGFLLLQDAFGKLGNSYISNTNIRCSWSGRQAFWKGITASDDHTVTLDNVWLAPAANRSTTNAVWPQTDDATYPAAYSSTSKTWTWPAGARIVGPLNNGIPGGGDFVPYSVVGTSYASPGYQ